ncbi:MAG: PEP-CTERM sorting domain-containing protein [Opitutaceae bacterium]
MMRTRILSMLPWKPIAIGATALLSSLSTANAVLHIDYTETVSGVTITYSGSYNAPAMSFGDPVLVTGASHYYDGSTFFGYTVTGDRTASSHSGLSGMASGFPYTATPTSFLFGTQSGNTGGIDSATSSVSYYAPSGYTLGDPISGSVDFASETLSDMNLPSSGSGTIDFVGVGGPENVTWGINGATVPEPSSFGLLLGCGALAFSLRRRRVADPART